MTYQRLDKLTASVQNVHLQLFCTHAHYQSLSLLVEGFVSNALVQTVNKVKVAHTRLPSIGFRS